MKILIEALGIENPGGGRTATINLLEHIFESDHQNSYILILSKEEPTLNRYMNVRQVVSPFKNRFIARIWAQLVIPIRFRNVDLVHFTKNLSVFGLKSPTIITIHDLTVLEYPEYFPWSDVFYWKTIQKLSVKAANLIIAVSENTAKDVTRYYGKDPNSIKVIYHGKSELFTPSSNSDIQAVREKYKLSDNYIITVGRIDVKKNLSILVKAFASIVPKIDPTYELILVGEIYKKCEDVHLLPTITASQMEDKVRLLGRVPDEDLPALYSGAQVSAFPSLHEGFGLVGLEAMACGVPVVTHNSGAIVEVVGDAALKVDGSCVTQLADGIEKVITQSSLRTEMIEAGLRRASTFNWNIAAQHTLDAYRQAYQSEL
jgi:glycosyltransferase involved in cell wall biosynthesis